MFDIGFFELMLIAGLGLIILGPERLPKAARTVGMYIGRIRRQMTNIQQDIERQIREEELSEKLKDPLKRFDDGLESIINPSSDKTDEASIAKETVESTKDTTTDDKKPS
jgi:sec-independent protein translocase protein TatB